MRRVAIFWLMGPHWFGRTYEMTDTDFDSRSLFLFPSTFPNRRIFIMLEQ